MGSLEMPLTGIWKISMKSLTPISQMWESQGSVSAVLVTDASAIYERRSRLADAIYLLIWRSGGSTVVCSFI